MMSYLYLVKNPGKNFGIELLSNDEDLLERFKERCYLMPKSLHWFHQGDSREWQFFEFWSDKESLFLEEAMKIADELQIELHLEMPTREFILALKTK